MEGKHRSLWIILALTIIGLDVCRCSTVSVPPEPVTTTEGAEFIIKCGIAATSDIEGVRVKRIVKEDGITEETVYQSLPPEWIDTDFDKTKYSLTNEGSLNVKITVKNVNFQDAGTYICEPIVLAENRATAAVVVLGKPLVTIPKITSEEPFQATCEVQFMAPPNIAPPTTEEDKKHFPELVGKVDNMEYEGTTKFTNGKLGTDINAKLEKIMNITLTESSNGKNFWCIARTPTPSHEETSSKVLDIKFEVTQPELPKNDLFYVGDVIYCQAEGNPKPDITWKPIKSKIKITRQENLTIIEEMVGEQIEEWVCEARNDIDGLPVVKKAKINFRVEPKDDAGTGEKKDAPDNTVAIALGVTIPLIIIGIAVALVVVLFIRNKKRKEKGPLDDETEVNTNKNSSENGNNNGKMGPLAADATYEDVTDGPTQAKSNSQGHNVRIQGEDPAMTAKRSETPMPDGRMTPLNDGLPGSRQPYQPRYDDVPEYPDMVSAHPGLQAAMKGEDKPRFPVYSSVNKPKAPSQPPPPSNQDYFDSEV